MRGTHLTLGRHDCDARAITKRSHRTLFMDLDACLDGGLGQPQHIVERVKMPASPIINAAMITGRVNMHAHRIKHNDIGRHIAKVPRHKVSLSPHVIKIAGLVRSFEMAGFQVAIDAMLRNPRPDPILRRIGNVKNRLRPGLSECISNLAHRPAQSRDQLPAVATRRTKANMLGLKQDNRIASFGAGKRRCHAGKAATDNADIGCAAAFKRRLCCKRIGACGIIAVGKRIGHHTRSSRCSRSHELITD